VRRDVTLTYGAALLVSDKNVYNQDLKRPAYLAPIFGGDLRPPHRGASVIDPSAGLAWNVRNKGKTVIRGAAESIMTKSISLFPFSSVARSDLPATSVSPVDGSVVGLSFLSTPTAFRGQDLLSILPGIRSTLASKLGDGTGPDRDHGPGHQAG